MSLAILRRTSGWFAMLCVAIAMSLAGETTVQAFEMAEHSSVHAVEAALDAADDSDATTDAGGASHNAGEDHHHPADHHSVGLLTDIPATQHALAQGASVAPTSGLRHAGLSGYGIERPPKA